MFDFGLRMRELRTKYNMSQDELGRRLGRSAPVISSYENNLKVPPLDILVHMATIFNVSLDYLVGLDKIDMISVNKLSDNQRNIINDIIFQLSNSSYKKNGLSDEQLRLVGLLIKEFCK